MDIICVFFSSKVAGLIGADPKEIVFTSGATESNNISVKGVARSVRSLTRYIFLIYIPQSLFMR